MATLCDFMPREEVLRLVLTGRTNKAFAAQISTSQKTVQFHLNKTYTKIEHQRAQSKGFGQLYMTNGQKLGKSLASIPRVIPVNLEENYISEGA